MKETSPTPWEAKNLCDNWIIVDSKNNVINIRDNEAHAKVMAAAPELRHALENLIIGIGMGWDLDGLIEVGETAIKKADDFNAADYIEFLDKK